jgi:hypothetical protein
MDVFKLIFQHSDLCSSFFYEMWWSLWLFLHDFLHLHSMNVINLSQCLLTDADLESSLDVLTPLIHAEGSLLL